MTTDIIHAFAISLVCLCIHIITQEHKILFPVRQLIDRLTATKLLAWIRKPLYDCLPCMGSIYGISFSLWFGYNLEQTIVAVLLTCGINCIWEAFIYGFRALIEINNTIKSMENGSDFPE